MLKFSLSKLRSGPRRTSWLRWKSVNACRIQYKHFLGNFSAIFSWKVKKFAVFRGFWVVILSRCRWGPKLWRPWWEVYEFGSILFTMLLESELRASGARTPRRSSDDWCAAATCWHFYTGFPGAPVFFFAIRIWKLSVGWVLMFFDSALEKCTYTYLICGIYQ